MEKGGYIFDIAALQHGFRGDLPPLVVVDLDRSAMPDSPLLLPPCPVIGMGDSAHPLAPLLDCVVEPPATLERLRAHILARPTAAAIFVQLLRAIEGLPLAQAIIAESLAFAALQGGAEHQAWLDVRVASAPDPAGALYVERDGDVLRLTTARPHAANAIDAAMRDALREALDLAALDRTIGRVEWRGMGKAFGVGADLGEFGTTRDPAMAHQIRMQTLPALAAIGCADRLVSHVQGLCVGSSLELAAFGRIEAERNAIFHLPELAMGIIPGAGGCVSLSAKIGRQRTALMVLSGRRIAVDKALEWGLVDCIVD